MKIIPKHTLPDFSLPLQIFHSVHVADAISKEGEEFEVFIGLDETYVKQLTQLSLDESDIELQNFTGDRSRFGEGSYKEWYMKNRTPFALVHKQSDALAALIWFGPKPLGTKSLKFGEEGTYAIQEEWHTVSFRSYPKFRGKGLMKNFSIFAMDIYKKAFPYSRFWTSTDDRSTIFVKLITGLGFAVDEENSNLSEHWLIMVKGE